MASLERDDGVVELSLEPEERAVVLRIIDALAPRVGQVARTRPHAYQNLAMEAEYRRWTLPEVERMRGEDIQAVRAALAAPEEVIRLDDAAVMAWTRALNHLRLVAGAILGIEDDGWEHGDGRPLTVSRPAEFAMLELLTDLQGFLIAGLEDG